MLRGKFHYSRNNELTPQPHGDSRLEPRSARSEVSPMLGAPVSRFQEGKERRREEAAKGFRVPTGGKSTPPRQHVNLSYMFFEGAICAPNIAWAEIRSPRGIWRRSAAS